MAAVDEEVDAVDTAEEEEEEVDAVDDEEVAVDDVDENVEAEEKIDFRNGQSWWIRILLPVDEVLELLVAVVAVEVLVVLNLNREKND